MADEAAEDDLVVEMINVKDYGVRGDGRTDDIAAFRAVFREAMERGGCAVYLPPGRYIIGLTWWRRLLWAWQDWVRKNIYTPYLFMKIGDNMLGICLNWSDAPRFATPEKHWIVFGWRIQWKAWDPMASRFRLGIARGC